MTDSTPSDAPKAKALYLPTTGTWPASRYLLDGPAQDAIALAVACGRPLLVRGFPGTGKSDLARAAAEHLGRAFVYEVVTARTEPQDLLWRFDAIARLADAQARGAGVGKTPADPAQPRHYVSPGVLWWAINWTSAENQAGKHCKTAFQRPEAELCDEGGNPVSQQQRATTEGCVLLLDEIDKADAELPNSLLEVLANTGFRLPWGVEEVKAGSDATVAPKPLIVVTTNEDRELPPAFVRRCLVVNLAVEGPFSDWIKARARVHFRNTDQSLEENDRRPALSDAVLDQAAEQLEKDRASSSVDGAQPGLAEYLDLLRGLHALAPDDTKAQLTLLKRVARFAYVKRAM